MSPVRPATASEPGLGFAGLLARYLSFVWLFEPEPARADRLTRMLIRRRNHELGRRYLPRYLARYLRLLLVFTLAGTGVEAMAAPTLVVAACFTVSSLAAAAAALTAVGLLWARRQGAGPR